MAFTVTRSTSSGVRGDCVPISHVIEKLSTRNNSSKNYHKAVCCHRVEMLYQILQEKHNRKENNDSCTGRVKYAPFLKNIHAVP